MAHTDSDQFEDPSDSYTREQNAILRGRAISALSPEDKVRFANAAARPLPCQHDDDRFRFNIDVEKLKNADPETKVRIHNDSSSMRKIRAECAELDLRMASETDPRLRSMLEDRRARLRYEGKLLMATIGRYEKKMH